MYRIAAVLTAGIALFLLTGAQHPAANTQIPPNHPAVQPQLPQGHPAIGQDGPAAPPPAAPADVASVDAIIKAYYSSVSGPKGQPRDWNRLRSLFIPEAHFLTTRPLDNAAMPMILSVDQFVEVNSTYFEKGGYFEAEIHRKVDTFGHMAQAFSTYESRHASEEAQPYSRGINSIQLMNDGMRWWIASIMWDYERPDTNVIPDEYAPQPAGDRK